MEAAQWLWVRRDAGTAYGPIRWPVEVFDFFLGGRKKLIVIATAASWLTLAILGRRSPELAWDEQLGQFIGFLGIAFTCACRYSP